MFSRVGMDDFQFAILLIASLNKLSELTSSNSAGTITQIFGPGKKMLFVQ